MICASATLITTTSCIGEVFDGCLRSCETLRDDVKPYVEIELSEPSEEDVALVRKFIEKVAEA